MRALLKSYCAGAKGISDRPKYLQDLQNYLHQYNSFPLAMLCWQRGFESNFRGSVTYEY